MKRLHARAAALLSAFGFSVACSSALAQKYAAETPEAVLTPDVVETQRLGPLRFFDGMPDEDTVRKAYDNLDFMRGVEAFLSGMPAASVYAMCHGFEQAGIPAHTVGISEDLLDARSLWLTANSTTVYVTTCLDLKKGAVVMEVAPGLLGAVNDAFFRWDTDIGVTGPDQGRGGRYLTSQRELRQQWRHPRSAPAPSMPSPPMTPTAPIWTAARPTRSPCRARCR